MKTKIILSSIFIVSAVSALAEEDISPPRTLITASDRSFQIEVPRSWTMLNPPPEGVGVNLGDPAKNEYISVATTKLTSMEALESTSPSK
jgi:hypothetical protein